MPVFRSRTGRWCLSVALVIVPPALLSGCTAAVAGAAVGAAESGAAIIKKGRVTTVVLAEYEQVIEAVHRARAVLSLDEQKVEEQGRRTAFFFTEPDGGKMSVRVARRTPSVTSLVIDVGSFGRSDVSRLMHLQVLDELDEAGAFLEEWRPGTLPGAGG